MTPLPADLTDWVRQVFDDASAHVANRIANVPNSPEGSLDTALIDALHAHSYPRVFPGGWVVRMEVHFIGGLRHYKSWEVADIGMVLAIRQNGKPVRSKVCLLQSKRLYPNNKLVDAIEPLDFQWGFGGLYARKAAATASGKAVRFDFNTRSKYGALTAGDDQHEAIKEFRQISPVPVQYLLYNPPSVPFSTTYPRTGPLTSCPVGLGAIVVDGKAVTASLDAAVVGSSPTFGEMFDGAKASWRLGTFVADEFLACRSGYVFTGVDDPDMGAVFYRRSGPIAASIAIGIDAPDDVDLALEEQL